MTTRKRTTASRRRRTTRSTSYRRRRTPSVASTVGTAVGLLLVTTLLDASWPVRIALVVLGVLLVGGYLVLKGRGTPAVPPTTTPEDPA